MDSTFNSAIPALQGGDWETLCDIPEFPMNVLQPCRLEPHQTSVSLIIPTCSNRQWKAGSLEYVLDGVERSEAVKEVVLVSPDMPLGEDSSLGPPGGNQRRIWCQSEKNNRARARNRGSRSSSGEYLLFLDDDMVLRDWQVIDTLLAHLREHGFSLALFPRRLYLRFPLLYDQCELRRMISVWQRTGELNGSCLINPAKESPRKKTIQFCFPGCFMLITRKAFDAMGGFDERFQGWGFEDADLALRACNQFRIFNLFDTAWPLLHIDHPVSPYKTDECRANYERLTSAFSLAEFDRLCSRAVSGKQFDDSVGLERGIDEADAVFCTLKTVYHIPFDADRCCSAYRQVLGNRLVGGSDSKLEYVLLHGSRGRGTSTARSDFDLLFLFASGRTREFFVSLEKGARVEFEFSDMDKFAEIAKRPSVHGLMAVLELTKLAQAQVVWGEPSAWERWSRETLVDAVSQGRLFWLVTFLGLTLDPSKHASRLAPLMEHLSMLLGAVDPAAYEGDIDVIRKQAPVALGQRVMALLEEAFPSWREAVAAGEKIFEHQVPETWHALQWLRLNQC